MERKKMEENRQAQETKRLILSWIWQSAIFLILFTAIFFLIAGDWSWVWGWMLVILLWLFMAAHPLLLIPINPELLAERARGTRTEGTKKWDIVIVMLASLSGFAVWIVGALDYRNGWSNNLSMILHVAGLILGGAGFGLFIWALVSNAYFAEGVRIQEERGHRVCEDGPYRFVRHPGYAGNILAVFGISLLMGSLWAFIPAALCGIFFSIRTYFEDQTLKQELPGYIEYTKKTPYRLLPGAW